jgi:ribosomal protein L37AE/L43A
MDISQIVITLLSQFWYLIPLFIFVTIIKSSWFKGVFGEFQVNLLIRFFLPKHKYHLIKNVTLLTDDGTTQIDHIIVSKYGVFVLETKNMKGWIFGSVNQKQWTQKIFKHTSRFQNPLHQNFKHLKVLESLLHLPSEAIFSVIVFIGDSTFKTVVPDNVTYAGGCIKYIKSKRIEVLTPEQVTDIVSIIESGRLARGLKTNAMHVAHVKEIIANKVGERDCPKCGSAMVLRMSRRGANAGSEFWGCSTFPKCRFTAV